MELLTHVSHVNGWVRYVLPDLAWCASLPPDPLTHRPVDPWSMDSLIHEQKISKVIGSCKRLVPSRLHELHESKFPFVSRIEFIRSKLSNFSAYVSGLTVSVHLVDELAQRPGIVRLPHHPEDGAHHVGTDGSLLLVIEAVKRLPEHCRERERERVQHSLGRLRQLTTRRSCVCVNTHILACRIYVATFGDLANM